jgi:hypothetical protein
LREDSQQRYEEYTLMIYDVSVLYIPTLQHLENFQYIENSSDMLKYSILKKTDIAVDL